MTDTIAPPILFAQGQLGQPTLVWIVVAVVVVLLVVALVVGLIAARRRRVSLRKDDSAPAKPTEGYRSSGQINFSAGTATRERPADVPAPDAVPGVPEEPTSPDGPPAGTAPAAPERAPAGPPTTAEPPAPRPAEPVESAPTQPAPTQAAPTQAAPTEAAPTEAAPTEAAPTEAAPTEAAPTEAAPTEAAPTEAAPTAPAPTAPAPTAPAPTESTPAEPAPAPEQVRPGAPTEPIAPPEGRLERLRGRLAGSRSSFGQGLVGLLGGGDLDDDSWDQVEDSLLMADLGAQTSAELIATLRTEIAKRGVRTPDQARQLLREVLIAALSPELDRAVHALPHDGRPAIVLVAGVNGTGKTTTTGKLARVLVASGRTVVLGAADTFRAAAAEQLVTWGERAGAAVVRGAEGADPASVAFDAAKRATEDGADVVLLDTAGRLHTKTGLMDELGKIKRVVSRQGDIDEVLLVLDATTGQNGVIQARVFSDVVNVTGVVLTKLDGTAKGGIVFRVQRELGVPVKLVGLGEGPDDLAPFEPAAFVDALLG
ncbi:MAG TPA: signal recognition particle-docking protein FtsY [Pseudonocardia sp.]|nr:signal recognition particle-docking protein FtsY [Pseudonocardia sp.]